MPVFPLNPHFKFRILEKWLKIFRSTKADSVTKESVAFADRERASSIPLSCFLTLFYIPVLLRWWVDCVWLMGGGRCCGGSGCKFLAHWMLYGCGPCRHFHAHTRCLCVKILCLESKRTLLLPSPSDKVFVLMGELVWFACGCRRVAKQTSPFRCKF